MPIEFNGSPKPTIGLELELQLINPETKELVPKSIEVLGRCRKLRLQRIKAEIAQAMIEIDTEISNDVKECRGHLEKRLRQLRAVTGEMGIDLASSGTHPFYRWTEGKIYPSERYRYLVDKFQWLALRLAVYGMHVHVGVEKRRKTHRYL